MEKQFVLYPEALALKKLGFDEECLATYHKELHTIIPIYGKFTNQDVIKAPLYQQAFTWFRTKYSLYHAILPLGYNMCIGNVGELGNLKACNTDKPHYGTYEEAELACLKKLINLSNENKDGTT